MLRSSMVLATAKPGSSRDSVLHGLALGLKKTSPHDVQGNMYVLEGKECFLISSAATASNMICLHWLLDGNEIGIGLSVIGRGDGAH